MRYRAMILALPVVAALQGCAGASQQQSPAQSATAQPPAKDALLTFFAAKDAYRRIVGADSLPPSDRDDAVNWSAAADLAVKTLADLDEKNAVVETCSGTAKVSAQFVAPALVGWGISEAVTRLVTEIDNTLQAEVKKYTVTHAAQSASFDFYGVLGNGKGFDRNRPSIACFRYTQRGLSDPTNPKSAPTLYLDFVGKVGYDPAARQIVTITPVRLFINRDVTLSSDRSVAVVMKLSADAVTLNAVQGTTAKGVIDASVVAAKIANVDQLNAGAFIYTVYDQKRVPSVEVPLPPWDAGSTPPTDRMRLILAVTETGNVPWLLKNVAALFHGNKGAIAKELITEADKYAGVTTTGTPSTSPAKPPAKSP
ncbi:MAG: hypothetical protein KGL11_09915 [Alphaproteobacteria bacterium]|nr:hypothetical protein [Alphaproteobacteria bacterium]